MSIWDVEGITVKGADVPMGVQIRLRAGTGERMLWFYLSGWKPGRTEHGRVAIVYRTYGEGKDGTERREIRDDEDYVVRKR